MSHPARGFLARHSLLRPFLLVSR